ncbi:hypothetical protein JG687_00000511 [Phytophthora cactorum]|uniref:Uncharacterized protein n=1 Tax=Phytophthora cactorum TaxID=29920 RepID=A0A8T1V0S8_9STRA|nr:hypothetical protein JG687_00000511 [Phytophthora cactorum]
MVSSEVVELTPTSNPYLDFYRKFAREHPGELTAVFDPELSDEARSEMYAALDVSVAMKYSWAIPDEREADEEPDEEEEEIEEESNDEEEVEVEQVYWTEVLKGTPKQDLRKHADRALFLCYPDDFEDSHESMAMASLCNYAGDTVIHVGELFGQTVCLPGAWGRTSSEEFQTHLATVYHKVLQVPLPSWHSSIDTLTVWKRTKSSITDGAMYAFIPENERIDLVAASPSTRHLLLLGNIDAEPTTTSKSKKRRRGKNKATGKQAEDDEHSPRASPCRASFMTKQRHSLTYSAEYEFGDDNILTAAYFEDTRLRNLQRIKHAHSVISTEAGGRTINNTKRIQQEQDRETEISQHNQILLERLDRIHKKVPKQFDVSHHTQERLSIKGPSNYPQWQREQERIAEENKKMKRRIDQTKSLFNTKQLAADAAKYLYLSEKLSKADRRMHLKQRCKQLNLQPDAKRGNSDRLACAGLFVGTRYILRAQERVRRRRAGLPGEETDEGASTLSKIQQVLGVDVGSSNLRVAAASLMDSAHEARVIESADGLRATPAAVAVDNGSVSVGAIAKSLQGRKPGYTATATRLLLGPATREREELIKNLPYTVHQRGETLELELDGKSYSPEWATEIMLDHLHTSAAASLGEDPIENFPAVLAVPAGTDEHERAAYEKVANSAGFTVFAAIDEPVAALHAAERCAVEELRSTEALSAKGPIAVFDIGGYVSTVSLLQKERRSGGFSLLHTLSTHAVSGQQVNELLFRSVVEKFKQEYGIDLSVDYMASYRILEAVESAKIELSSRVSTDINLPFITADQKGAKHLVHKVTSFDLARIQEGPATEAVALCNQALNETGVSKEDLSALVLVGGGAKSEFIREQLEMFFKRSAFSTKSFRPEEAVVLGAAEYGRKLVQEY